MGGGESKQAPRGQREIRQSVAMPNRLPMPDHGELEETIHESPGRSLYCIKVVIVIYN